MEDGKEAVGGDDDEQDNRAYHQQVGGGQLRKEVDSYKAKTVKWQSRAQALSKQLTDLGAVMKKYIIDTKTRPRDKVSTVHVISTHCTQCITGFCVSGGAC